jgi:hypothetical protein
MLPLAMKLHPHSSFMFRFEVLTKVVPRKTSIVTMSDCNSIAIAVEWIQSGVAPTSIHFNINGNQKSSHCYLFVRTDIHLPTLVELDLSALSESTGCQLSAPIGYQLPTFTKSIPFIKICWPFNQDAPTSLFAVQCKTREY